MDHPSVPTTIPWRSAAGGGQGWPKATAKRRPASLRATRRRATLATGGHSVRLSLPDAFRDRGKRKWEAHQKEGLRSHQLSCSCSRTLDHLVETALTVVAAYGSFLLADHLGVSGVLATVSAGLLMGNLGVLKTTEQGLLTSQGRAFVLAFWEFAAFIANSIIFLLIGLTVAGIPFNGLGVPAILLVILLVLVGRALSVYPLCLPFRWTRWAIPVSEQHVLWWGGLRGALSLGLVLALPPSLAYRDEIIIAAFGVVVFSVMVEGLTMPPLLRVLGFLPKPRRCGLG